MSKMFSRFCDNKNSVKGEIITFIKIFPQTMLIAIIDTSDINKAKHIKLHEQVFFNVVLLNHTPGCYEYQGNL